MAILLLVLSAAGILGGAAALRNKQRHSAHRLRLSDGTLLCYRGDSKATPSPGYPDPREIRLDGDFLVRAAPAARPLLLRSRLLEVTVHGAGELRMTAFSSEPGEEVDVLSGRAEAAKAYPSPYREPDQLTDGEMSMVNKDIDLMEKERFDPATLGPWVESLARAAACGVP